MFRAVVLTLLLSALAAPAYAERSVVAKRAGCSISVGDKDAAGLSLFVADCVWPVASAKVIAAVKAIDKYDEYFPSVKESTLLADGRVLQIHQASGISDRQITLKFTNEELADGGFKTSWIRADTQEPLRGGVVDAPVDAGMWEVHPDGGGSTVSYQLKYDVGGEIPTWLAQSFQNDRIADVVEEMRAAADR